MDETLYQHAGGDEGLHRLEELFYAKALADPVLRELFTERVPTQFGSQVAQQNSWAESDADLHPIRAVPAWSWPGGE